MDKLTLMKSLDNRAFQVFGPNEINEPIIMSYTQIRVAIRQDCDGLIIRSDRILLIKDGNTTGELVFPVGTTQGALYTAFREAILAIYSRDQLLKPYLDLAEASDQQLVFRVSPPLSK